MQFDLAFIGAGNMAEAIVTAVTGAGIYPLERVIASDPAPARLSLFSGMGITCTPSNADAARQAHIVMLCVKPQMMPHALAGIAQAVNEGQLFVTIAAGVSTKFVEDGLGGGRAWRVVRVMPNTPMLVGEGAAAVCRGRYATDDDVAVVQKLFESAGTVIDVDEPQMDTVTAVSGSGPAYFFHLVEQMIAAGVELGLTPLQAQELVYQTAVGAAKMLRESTDSPAELRRKVTSPGGTTQAAMEVIESSGVGEVLRRAVGAAQRRGRELGQ